MSSYVSKVRLKQTCGNAPKGYELQVVHMNSSAPSGNQVLEALTKLGFKVSAGSLSWEKIK